MFTKTFKKTPLVESEPIAALMYKNKWSKVLRVVTPGKSQRHSCDALCCNKCSSFHAPLQFACYCNPPVTAIRAMIKADPSAVNEVDCMERLPLHIACEYGASPEVIRLLMESNPSATMRKDKLGRLPVHTLCENYAGWFEPQLSEDEIEAIFNNNNSGNDLNLASITARRIRWRDVSKRICNRSWSWVHNAESLESKEGKHYSISKPKPKRKYFESPLESASQEGGWQVEPLRCSKCA